MKFLKFKNMAMIGALSIAGVGLIGVGAHATFTQNTVSQQPITAGTMNVQLSTPAAGASLSQAGQVLTFASPAAVGSSFTTGDMLVNITNYSNIPVGEITATPGDTYDSSGGLSSANSLMAAEVYLCETSSNEVIYNGLLSAAPAQQINGTLAAYPGSASTDNYTVNIYAGTGVSACGADTSVGSTVPASPALNPAAGTAGLDNLAQGGVIAPPMTISYTG